MFCIGLKFTLHRFPIRHQMTLYRFHMKTVGNVLYWPTVYTAPFSYPASNDTIPFSYENSREMFCIGLQFTLHRFPIRHQMTIYRFHMKTVGKCSVLAYSLHCTVFLPGIKWHNTVVIRKHFHTPFTRKHFHIVFVWRRYTRFFIRSMSMRNMRLKLGKKKHLRNIGRLSFK